MSVKQIIYLLCDYTRINICSITQFDYLYLNNKNVHLLLRTLIYLNNFHNLKNILYCSLPILSRVVLYNPILCCTSLLYFLPLPQHNPGLIY